MPEQILEVLIGKMGKDRDVDAILRKCAGVLGEAERCQPIGYFLHRRPRPTEFRPRWTGDFSRYTVWRETTKASVHSQDRMARIQPEGRTSPSGWPRAPSSP